MVMLGIISTYAPLFWLAAAVLFSIIEALTFGLWTIWFALSAVVMIFVSLLPVSVGGQCVSFALLSLVLLLVTKPLVHKKLQAHKERTNAASLVGKKVFTLSPITATAKGAVKVNGLIWAAASIDELEVAQNTACIIERIEGVTLILRKL
ncbi:MAG: NfeD family protein [Treponema sp.]